MGKKHKLDGETRLEALKKEILEKEGSQVLDSLLEAAKRDAKRIKRSMRTSLRKHYSMRGHSKAFGKLVRSMDMVAPHVAMQTTHLMVEHVAGGILTRQRKRRLPSFGTVIATGACLISGSLAASPPADIIPAMNDGAVCSLCARPCPPEKSSELWERQLSMTLLASRRQADALMSVMKEALSAVMCNDCASVVHQVMEEADRTKGNHWCFAYYVLNGTALIVKRMEEMGLLGSFLPSFSLKEGYACMQGDPMASVIAMSSKDKKGWNHVLDHLQHAAMVADEEWVKSMISPVRVFSYQRLLSVLDEGKSGKSLKKRWQRCVVASKKADQAIQSLQNLLRLALRGRDVLLGGVQQMTGIILDESMIGDVSVVVEESELAKQKENPLWTQRKEEEEGDWLESSSSRSSDEEKEGHVVEGGVFPCILMVWKHRHVIGAPLGEQSLVEPPPYDWLEQRSVQRRILRGLRKHCLVELDGFMALSDVGDMDESREEQQRRWQQEEDERDPVVDWDSLDRPQRWTSSKKSKRTNIRIIEDNEEEEEEEDLDERAAEMFGSFASEVGQRIHNAIPDQLASASALKVLDWIEQDIRRTWRCNVLPKLHVQEMWELLHRPGVQSIEDKVRKRLEECKLQLLRSRNNVASSGGRGLEEQAATVVDRAYAQLYVSVNNVIMEDIKLELILATEGVPLWMLACEEEWLEVTEEEEEEGWVDEKWKEEHAEDRVEELSSDSVDDDPLLGGFVEPDTEDEDTELLGGTKSKSFSTKVRKKRAPVSIDKLSAETRQVMREEAQRLERLSQQASTTLKLSSHLRGVLRPHQIEAVRFMWDNVRFDKGCVLAHAMGLGKTLSVVALLHAMMRQAHQCHKALVLCPTSVVENWESEFRKWLPKEEAPPVFLFGTQQSTPERVDIASRWILNGGVLVCGHEMFHRLVLGDVTIPKAQRAEEVVDKNSVFYQAMCNPGADIIVVDEAHRIKNPETLISKTVRLARTMRRVCLTGYPIQNKLMEYWCMVDWCRPRLLGTQKEFHGRFEVPIREGLMSDASRESKVIAKQRIYILQHLELKGVVQRKSEALLRKELPPRYDFIVLCRLSPLQEKLYEAFLDMREQIGTNNTDLIFESLPLLRLLVAHPELLKAAAERWDKEHGPPVGFARTPSPMVKSKPLVDSIEVITVDDSEEDEEETEEVEAKRLGRAPRCERLSSLVWARRILAERPQDIASRRSLHDSGKMYVATLYIKEKKCRKALLMILEETRRHGEKALVFSQSIPTLNFIEAVVIPVLRERGPFGYVRLDGSTLQSHRQGLINKFNKGDAVVFLNSTRAGGIGVNLTAANRVVLVDLDWNPGHEIQAIFRSYRLGQKKPVYIYRLISEGTFESQLYKRQLTKEGLSRRVVDSSFVRRTMSSKEYRNLFKLSVPSLRSPDAEKVNTVDLILNKLVNDLPDVVDFIEHEDQLKVDSEEMPMTEVQRENVRKAYEKEKAGLMDATLDEDAMQPFVKGGGFVPKIANDNKDVERGVPVDQRGWEMPANHAKQAGQAEPWDHLFRRIVLTRGEDWEPEGLKVDDIFEL